MSAPKPAAGELADKFGDHVTEAQMHLALLARHLVEVLAGRGTERAHVDRCLVDLTASLSHLEELGCDVREVEERLESRRAPRTGRKQRTNVIDFATARRRRGLSP